jgi:hypothetical protein
MGGMTVGQDIAGDIVDDLARAIASGGAHDAAYGCRCDFSGNFGAIDEVHIFAYHAAKDVLQQRIVRAREDEGFEFGAAGQVVASEKLGFG